MRDKLKYLARIENAGLTSQLAFCGPSAGQADPYCHP